MIYNLTYIFVFWAFVTNFSQNFNSYPYHSNSLPSDTLKSNKSFSTKGVFVKQTEGQNAVNLKIMTPHLGTQYLAYFPKGYNSQPNRSWPAIIFLHGSGERGSDIHLVKRQGIPKFLDTAQNFSFLVFSPQCPSGIYWNYLDELHSFLKLMEKKYNVDTNRVYLTGLSAGGYGTWDWAEAYPNDFAAIVPVSGAGRQDQAYKIRSIPIWVFHGLKDRVVKIEQDEAIVRTLLNQGAEVNFTVYKNSGHDIWDSTYHNPDLYKWMLDYHRTSE